MSEEKRERNELNAGVKWSELAKCCWKGEGKVYSESDAKFDVLHGAKRSEGSN